MIRTILGVITTLLVGVFMGVNLYELIPPSDGFEASWFKFWGLGFFSVVWSIVIIRGGK